MSVSKAGSSYGAVQIPPPPGPPTGPPQAPPRAPPLANSASTIEQTAANVSSVSTAALEKPKPEEGKGPSFSDKLLEGFKGVKLKKAPVITEKKAEPQAEGLSLLIRQIQATQAIQMQEKQISAEEIAAQNKSAARMYNSMRTTTALIDKLNHQGNDPVKKEFEEELKKGAIKFVRILIVDKDGNEKTIDREVAGDVLNGNESIEHQIKVLGETFDGQKKVVITDSRIITPHGVKYNGQLTARLNFEMQAAATPAPKKKKDEDEWDENADIDHYRARVAAARDRQASASAASASSTVSAPSVIATPQKPASSSSDEPTAPKSPLDFVAEMRRRRGELGEKMPVTASVSSSSSASQPAVRSHSVSLLSPSPVPASPSSTSSSSQTRLFKPPARSHSVSLPSASAASSATKPAAPSLPPIPDTPPPKDEPAASVTVGPLIRERSASIQHLFGSPPPSAPRPAPKPPAAATHRKSETSSVQNRYGMPVPVMFPQELWKKKVPLSVEDKVKVTSSLEKARGEFEPLPDETSEQCLKLVEMWKEIYKALVDKNFPTRDRPDINKLGAEGFINILSEDGDSELTAEALMQKSNEEINDLQDLLLTIAATAIETYLTIAQQKQASPV